MFVVYVDIYYKILIWMAKINYEIGRSDCICEIVGLINYLSLGRWNCRMH